MTESVFAIRQNIIINDEAAIFDMEDGIDLDPNYGSLYRSHFQGALAVETYKFIIEQKAQLHGVNPDIIKSIMYLENSQGHYFGLSSAAEFVGLADSLMPMNINPSLWSGLMPAGSDFSNADVNIEAGVILIKRISDKLAPEDRTIKNIATLYNDLTENESTDFGARAESILSDSLWLQDQDNGFGGVTYANLSTMDETIYQWTVLAHAQLVSLPEKGYAYITNPLTGDGVLYQKINGEVQKIDYPTYDPEADNPNIFTTYDVSDGSSKNSKVYQGDIQQNFEQLNATLVGNEIIVDTENDFSIIEEGLTAIIDGIDYVATEVADSISSAAEAVAEFVSKQVGDAASWLTSNNVDQVFAQWFAANIDDLINGNLSTEDGLISLAANDNTPYILIRGKYA